MRLRKTNESGIIKDVDEKSRIVKGVFSAFDNVDSQGDIIKRGAYQKTINEIGPKSLKPRIKHFLDHNPFKTIGVLQELWEDSDGLNYISKLGTHTLGEDALRMHKEGIITEHSVMIEVVKSNYDEKSDANIITECIMWEGSSLQAWGANPNTPTKAKWQEQIKSDPWKAFERYKKLNKALRKSEVSEETLYDLQIEMNNIEIELMDLLKDHKPTGDPVTFDNILKSDSFDLELSLSLSNL